MVSGSNGLGNVGVELLGLSAAERSLVAFAAEWYGVPLAHILLTGLGENWDARRCRLELGLRPKAGPNRHHTLRIVSCGTSDDDSESRLPRGREPLVLLALLYMRRREMEKGEVFSDFLPEDVLDLLGWGLGQGPRLLLEESIRRYLGLEYLLSSQWIDAETGAAMRLEQRGRLFESYRLTAAPVRGLTCRLSCNELFMDMLTAQMLFGFRADDIETIERADC